MKGSSLVTLALVGGGAVVLLDYLGVITIPWLNNYITPYSGGTSPQAADSGATKGIDTLNAMMVLLKKDGLDANSLLSVSQWNFYYNAARGIAGPDPVSLFPTNPNATTEKFSLSEWWSAMTTAGFSGLGMIAHQVNPYLLGPRTTMHPFGAGLAPTGVETMIKRVG